MHDTEKCEKQVIYDLEINTRYKGIKTRMVSYLIMSIIMKNAILAPVSRVW